MGPPRHRPAMLPACLCVGPWPCRLSTRGITSWVQGLVATQSQGDACRARLAFELAAISFSSTNGARAFKRARTLVVSFFVLPAQAQAGHTASVPVYWALAPPSLTQRHCLPGQRLASHPVARRYLLSAGPAQAQAAMLPCAYVLGRGQDPRRL